jgi:hypothetical protein
MTSILIIKEKAMSQAQLMTLEEEAAIALKAFELKDQGKLEEYERVRKQIPLQPYLAKFVFQKRNFYQYERL